MAKIWQKKITLYTLSIALIAAICFVGKLKNIPFEKLTGDPAMVNDTNPLVSFLSNLGALLWCASCTICFFTAYSIQSKYRKKDFDFLLYSGIFSLILLFDDFFMVHDYLIYFWILQFAHLKVKISSGFWIVKAIPYQAWV